MTKHPVVGAFVRTALTDQKETEQEGDKWRHLSPIGDAIRRVAGSLQVFHRPAELKIQYSGFSSTKTGVAREGSREADARQA
jgi:hypothetical protein